MKEIDNAIEELRYLNTTSGISMNKISWWLLKYEDLFKTSDSEISPLALPSLNQLNSIEIKFRSLYEILMTLEDIKAKESIFQKRFDLYNSIKDDSIKFKDWIDLNKEEALESHFDLWFEWTDHDPEKIKPFILYWQHLDISIPVSDFEYTLKVLKIFHEHYWEDQE